MTVYSLENAQIHIEVNSFRGELKLLKKQRANKEHLWDARPEYRKRTSPALFPIAGSLNNGSYRLDGHNLVIPQKITNRDNIFEGDLSERAWGNRLLPSEEFYAEYTITV